MRAWHSLHSDLPKILSQMSSPVSLGQRTRTWIRSLTLPDDGMSTLPFKLGRIMELMYRELYELLDSKWLPDWAREEIGARLDSRDLNQLKLIETVREAQEDMYDLNIVSGLPASRTEPAASTVTGNWKFSGIASDQFGQLATSDREDIIAKLDALGPDPLSSGEFRTVRAQDRLGRIRAGDHRLLCKCDGVGNVVVHIGHRSKVYGGQLVAS